MMTLCCRVVHGVRHLDGHMKSLQSCTPFLVNLRPHEPTGITAAFLLSSSSALLPRVCPRHTAGAAVPLTYSRVQSHAGQLMNVQKRGSADVAPNQKTERTLSNTLLLTLLVA